MVRSCTNCTHCPVCGSREKVDTEASRVVVSKLPGTVPPAEIVAGLRCVAARHCDHYEERAAQAGEGE